MLNRTTGNVNNAARARTLWRLLVVVAVIPALIGTFGAPESQSQDVSFVWSGQGITRQYHETAHIVNNFSGPAANLTSPELGGNHLVYINWFQPVSPSGTDIATYSTTLPGNTSNLRAHLTIVDHLHSNRTVLLMPQGGGDNVFESLAIGTTGSLTIGSPAQTGEFYTYLNQGLVRHAGASGVHVIHRNLVTNQLYLNGSGSVEYRAPRALLGFGGEIYKNGTATLLYAPQGSTNLSTNRPINVTGGTLDLSVDPGNGNALLDSIVDWAGVVLRVARNSAFDTPPASIPISGVYQGPVFPPTPQNARAIVRYNNATYTGSKVEVGVDGVLQFEPAQSEITFNSTIVTQASAPVFNRGQIRKTGPNTAILPQSLNGFLGEINIDQGVLRLHHNATGRNVVNIDAGVLELAPQHIGHSRYYDLDYRGYGVVRKVGPGRAVLSPTAASSSFQGSFHVSAGELITGNGVDNINSIFNNLLIENDGVVHLGGNNTIHDSTVVSLLGGSFHLNFSEKIERLGLLGPGRVTLGQAGISELRMGSNRILVLPSANDTEAPIIQQFNSFANTGIHTDGGTLTVEVADGPLETDFIMQDVRIYGHLAKTGTGRMRHSGPIGGLTWVTEGTLELVSGNLNHAGPMVSNISVGSTFYGTNGRLIISRQNIFSSDSNLTLSRSSEVILNGYDQTAYMLNFSGAGSALVKTGPNTLGVTERLSAMSSNQGTIDITSGTLSLLNPAVSIEVDTNAQLKITGGQIAGCEIIKAGQGPLHFQNTTGNVALRIAAGTARAENATFGGLRGTGTLELLDNFTANKTSGADTFSGLITGSGSFTKTGAGTLTLSGSGANTFTGTTTVSGGTLVLNRQGVSVGGNLVVEAGGKVTTARSIQFDVNTSNITVSGGELDFDDQQQDISSLTVAAGGVVKNGLFQSVGSVNVSHANLEKMFGLIYGGGLHVTGQSHADFYGAVAGNSELGSGATLRVSDQPGYLASELYFADQLHARNGSRLELLPGAAGDPALVKINGPLLVGSPVFAPFASPPHRRMDGTLTVDLSTSSPLAAGVYSLIDFSTAPYTFALPIGGSIYAQMNNFNTIAPPDTAGSFAITNNVLKFISEGITTYSADFNQDGMVDGNDLAVWESAFGNNALADANGDGYSDGIDFLTWQREFDSGVNPLASAQAVPEPSALVLLMLGGALKFGKRIQS